MPFAHLSFAYLLGSKYTWNTATANHRDAQQTSEALEVSEVWARLSGFFRLNLKNILRSEETYIELQEKIHLTQD